MNLNYRKNKQQKIKSLNTKRKSRNYKFFRKIQCVKKKSKLYDFNLYGAFKFNRIIKRKRINFITKSVQLRVIIETNHRLIFVAGIEINRSKNCLNKRGREKLKVSEKGGGVLK